MLLSIIAKSGKFHYRRGKRRRISLALICIRLRLTAYRQGITLCPFSSKGLQSLRFGLVKRVPLPFLLCAVSGGLTAVIRQKRMKTEQFYAQPLISIIELHQESIIMQSYTDPTPGGSEGIGGGEND